MRLCVLCAHFVSFVLIETQSHKVFKLHKPDDGVNYFLCLRILKIATPAW